MKFHKKIWMSFRKKLFLLFNKRYYIKHVQGVTCLLDMRNRVDRHIDAFSVYEKPQIDFLFSRLREIDCNCFIDIGSHWGHYSLSFAKEDSFKNAEIHAFEPDKVNRYQLYANLFLNRLQERIHVHEYAVSSNEGELRFHHFAENNRGRSGIAADGEFVVKTVKLDTVIPYKDKKIGIKVDVEGHELDVISGMEKILLNNICMVQIESFDEVLSDLHEKMTGLGYSLIKSIESDHYFSNKEK